MKVTTLKLDSIIVDPELVTRECAHENIIAEYSERMRAGDKFPALEIVRDRAGVHRLIDGRLRLEAAHEAGLTRLPCIVRPGNRRAALLASAAANATNGERRSEVDKVRAVQKLLDDREWRRWSDRAIARHCRVSHTFVAGLRPRRTTEVTGNVASEGPVRRYLNRYGHVATMRVAGIGRSHHEEEPISITSSPPQDTDEYVNVSAATARFVTGRLSFVVEQLMTLDEYGALREPTIAADVLASFKTEDLHRVRAALEFLQRALHEVGLRPPTTVVPFPTRSKDT